MSKLNENVVSWLETGNFRAALLGQNECFIPDPWNPATHDYLLVTYVLINWADQAGRATDVGAQLDLAMLELASTDPIDLLDVLLAYAINASGLKKPVLFDAPKVLDAVRRQLSQGQQTDSPSPSDMFAERLADLRTRYAQLKQPGPDSNRQKSD